MKIVIVALVFITTMTIMLAIWQHYTSRRRLIEKRMDYIVNREEKKHAEELDKPFKERIATPFFEKTSLLLLKLMPKFQRESLRKKLSLAGNPFGLRPHEFSGLQYFLGILFASIGFAFMRVNEVNLTNMIIISVIFAIIGFKLPQVYIKIKAQKRQKDIDKSLPGVVDLLAVSVESGLGFDAALSRVIAKTKGVLSYEFNITLHEIKMGKPRREALKDMVIRTDTDNLANFISAVLQADGLGVSMSKILRIQSDRMRIKRRQRAEEEAMKAPVKMLLPMVLFIFPSIFIILLGPAFINIFTELF